MSLQGLLGGTNPLLVLAAALLYFLFLYLRRGGDHRDAEYDRSTGSSTEHAGSHSTSTSSASHSGSHTTGHTTSHSAAHSTGHTSGHTSGMAATVRTDANGVTSGGWPTVRGIYEDIDYTEDTLRRHNTVYRDWGAAGTAGVAAGTIAAGAAAASGSHTHHSEHHGEHRSAAGATTTTSTARDTYVSETHVRNTHVPEEFSYEGGGGGSWKWPVIAALCASLVSCQIASKDGIAGIPKRIAEFYGYGSPVPVVVGKIEAKVPDVKAKVEEVKAKATEVVETTKAKVVAAAEKAVEAAKPEPKPEPKPVAAAPEPAPAPAPVPGLTSYFGFADKPDSTQAWAAPATVFIPVVAAAQVPAPAPEAKAPEAAPAPAPAPAPVAEAAPVSSGGVGQTSYFGIAEKPDASFAWAAPAKMNPDYKVAEPAPAPAAPETAPVSLGGVGQTSYFGIAERPDATYPWAAAATVYKVAAPAPAPKAPAPTPAAIENCRDALNAEAQAGKINFATSSYDLLPESNRTLDKIAKLAKDCGGVVIEVGGHTDSTGKPASNQTLSEQRAKAVVNYLTGAGVPASKLKSAGYGQDRPIADNATDAGKKQNRRIEFLVTAP